MIEIITEQKRMYESKAYTKDISYTLTAINDILAAIYKKNVLDAGSIIREVASYKRLMESLIDEKKYGQVPRCFVVAWETAMDLQDILEEFYPESGAFI